MLRSSIRTISSTVAEASSGLIATTLPQVARVHGARATAGGAGGAGAAGAAATTSSSTCRDGPRTPDRSTSANSITTGPGAAIALNGTSNAPDGVRASVVTALTMNGARRPPPPAPVRRSTDATRSAPVATETATTNGFPDAMCGTSMRAIVGGAASDAASDAAEVCAGVAGGNGDDGRGSLDAFADAFAADAGAGCTGVGSADGGAAGVGIEAVVFAGSDGGDAGAVDGGAAGAVDVAGVTPVATAAGRSGPTAA